MSPKKRDGVQCCVVRLGQLNMLFKLGSTVLYVILNRSSHLILYSSFERLRFFFSGKAYMKDILFLMQILS